VHEPSAKPAMHANTTAAERLSIMRAVRFYLVPGESRREVGLCCSCNPGRQMDSIHGDTVIGRWPRFIAPASMIA
jgi:hypothetical protein